MITTDGKNILAKFLLNQAPEFASHIAVGVGGNAQLSSASAPVTFSLSAQSLNFEVARIPITAKGLIKEDGVEKIAFKAQIPTDRRYQITELGIYPAESNVLAERYDSRLISTFSSIENWISNVNGANLAIVDFGEIAAATNGDIIQGSSTAGSAYAFVNNNSQIFQFDSRKKKNEPPRILSKSLMVIGNSASMDASFNHSASSNYIQNSSIILDFSKNLPEDKIKLAFSLLANGVASGPPTAVRIKLMFLNGTNQSASVGMYVPASTFSTLTPGTVDITQHYQVVSKNISDFVKSSPDFSWSEVSKIRIYVAVEDAAPSNYYVALDGLKIDNVSTVNPIYSLVAADYMKTSDAYPALKKENSISYTEYRFGLDI